LPVNGCLMEATQEGHEAAVETAAEGTRLWNSGAAVAAAAGEGFYKRRRVDAAAATTVDASATATAGEGVSPSVAAVHAETAAGPDPAGGAGPVGADNHAYASVGNSTCFSELAPVQAAIPEDLLALGEGEGAVVAGRETREALEAGTGYNGAAGGAAGARAATVAAATGATGAADLDPAAAAAARAGLVTKACSGARGGEVGTGAGATASSPAQLAAQSAGTCQARQLPAATAAGLPSRTGAGSSLPGTISLLTSISSRGSSSGYLSDSSSCHSGSSEEGDSQQHFGHCDEDNSSCGDGAIAAVIFGAAEAGVEVPIFLTSHVPVKLPAGKQAGDTTAPGEAALDSRAGAQDGYGATSPAAALLNATDVVAGVETNAPASHCAAGGGATHSTLDVYSTKAASPTSTTAQGFASGSLPAGYSAAAPLAAVRSTNSSRSRDTEDGVPIKVAGVHSLEGKLQHLQRLAATPATASKAVASMGTAAEEGAVGLPVALQALRTSSSSYGHSDASSDDSEGDSYGDEYSVTDVPCGNLRGDPMTVVMASRWSEAYKMPVSTAVAAAAAVNAIGMPVTAAAMAGLAVESVVRQAADGGGGSSKWPGLESSGAEAGGNVMSVAPQRAAAEAVRSQAGVGAEAGAGGKQKSRNEFAAFARAAAAADILDTQKAVIAEQALLHQQHPHQEGPEVYEPTMELIAALPRCHYLVYHMQSFRRLAGYSNAFKCLKGWRVVLLEAVSLGEVCMESCQVL
jgi:hypothetical protein